MVPNSNRRAQSSHSDSRDTRNQLVLQLHLKPGDTDRVTAQSRLGRQTVPRPQPPGQTSRLPPQETGNQAGKPKSQASIWVAYPALHLRAWPRYLSLPGGCPLDLAQMPPPSRSPPNLPQKGVPPLRFPGQASRWLFYTGAWSCHTPGAAPPVGFCKQYGGAGLTE